MLGKVDSARRVALLLGTTFLHINRALMNATRVRIFGQPENKITETEKCAKISPIVLPSTAVFTCFNRPQNKNARSNNSLSKCTFSHTLDIKRCAFIVFFSSFFH